MCRHRRRAIGTTHCSPPTLRRTNAVGRIPRGAIVVLRTGWGRHWENPGIYFGADTSVTPSVLHFPELRCGRGSFARLAWRGDAGRRLTVDGYRQGANLHGARRAWRSECPSARKSRRLCGAAAHRRHPARTADQDTRRLRGAGACRRTRPTPRDTTVASVPASQRFHQMRYVPFSHALDAALGALAGCASAPQLAEANLSTTGRSLLLSPEDAEWRKPAPAISHLLFETTKGVFVLEVVRAWGPHGADRLYNLVRLGYYNDTRFHRVRPGYIAQWGLHGDSAVNAAWKGRYLVDDPPRSRNARGTFGFSYERPGREDAKHAALRQSRR